MEKHKQHNHVYFQREWYELRDHHFVIWQRVQCRCQKIRSEIIKIIALSEVIDRRSQKPPSEDEGD